jgi:hypothetical protein
MSLRRLSRQVQPSTRLRNFITYSVHYPIQNYISYNHISNEYYAFLSSLSRIEELNLTRRQGWIIIVKLQTYDLNTFKQPHTNLSLITVFI